MPSWHGVLVLNYHRVGRGEGTPWDHDLWSATAEAFDAQVADVARGAEVVGPEDLLRGGMRKRGRRVMFTFDDGYRDNYELAFPVLCAHGVPATFFVVTGFMDRGTTAWWDEIAWMVRTAEPGRAIGAGAHLAHPVARTDGDTEAVVKQLVARYKELSGDATNAYLDHLGHALETGRCPDDPGHWMTWDMAREMQAAGMAIGGHTVTHPVLARLPVEEQRAEVRGCGERLREELGGPMRWFSYPVGSQTSFTPETQRIVAAEGVEVAFSFYGGVGRPTLDRLLDVRRVHVGPHMTPSLLRATIHAPRLFARAG